MEWHKILNKIKKEHKSLVVIDFNNIICNESTCFSSLNNVALYRDNQHLTYVGSEQIGIEYLKQHANPFKKQWTQIDNLHNDIDFDTNEFSFLS